MAGETLKLVKDPIKHGFTIPSSVYLSDSGEMLVGHAADYQRLKNPLRYRREFKRILGSDEPLALGDRLLRPEELIAEVLKTLKREAEKMMEGLLSNEQRLRSAVITVPATYQENKRSLMRQSAGWAGFEEVELLEEPVAAAMYHADWVQRAGNGKAGQGLLEGEVLLVYDLGGGTFDAALIQKKGDGYESVAVPVGMEQCGGMDFDREISEDVKRSYPEAQALLDGQRRDEVVLLARGILTDFCREMKHQLSAAQEAEDMLMLPGTMPESYRLTRAAFNAMITPYVERTCEVCQQLVKWARMEWKDVRGVLLVGGSCRIPHVGEVVERAFGRPVYRVDEPELSVCLGAAVYGARRLSEVMSPQAKEAPQQPEEAQHLEESVSPQKADSQLTTARAEVFSTLKEVVRQEEEKAHQEAQAEKQEEDVVVVSPEAGVGKYTSIGEAMRSIKPGGRILVQPGVYREGVVIDKPVEIVGENAVLESTNSSCLVMQTDFATVRGLTMRCLDENQRHFAVDIPQGQLTLENCDITSNSFACIAIFGPAAPVIRHCKIHDGKRVGICVWKGGAGTVEDCDIFGNALSGVQISAGGNPVLRNCRIYDGRHSGVSVYENGKGELEGCDIFGNALSGVTIKEGGNPVVRHCKIRDGHRGGIFVWKGGAGTVEDCDISGNALSGVEIAEGGNPVIRRCRINENIGWGVYVQNKGSGTVENCDLADNGGGEWNVEPGCQVRGYVEAKVEQTKPEQTKPQKLALPSTDVKRTDDIYSKLRQFLQNQQWDAADNASIAIIRGVSGHACIDSEQKAREIPDEVLRTLDALWIEAGGGPLKEREWVKNEGAGVCKTIPYTLKSVVGGLAAGLGAAAVFPPLAIVAGGMAYGMLQETWLQRRLKEVGLTGNQAYDTAKAETQQKQEITAQQATKKATNQKERKPQKTEEVKQEPHVAGALQKQTTPQAKTKSDEAISQADFGKEYLALARKRLVAQNFEWLENVRHADETFLCVARKKSLELLKGGSTQTDYIFQRFDHFTAESLADLAKKAFSFYSSTRSSFWVNMSSWVNMLNIYCVPVALVNGIDVATIKQVVDMEPSGGKLPNSFVTVMMMPVVYDVQSKSLCIPQKTPFWGAAMWPGFRKMIQQTLSP